MDDETHVDCSFCGKSLDEVRKMIAGGSPDGPTVHICDECVDLCNDIILHESSPSVLRLLRMAWRTFWWKWARWSSPPTAKPEKPATSS
jgi:hypothetical protein